MSAWEISLLANEHCHTGENPLWDDERDCVYWSDIPAGKLFRYDCATRSHEQIYSGPPVGGFTLQADGSLLLCRVNDVALLPWRGAARPILEFRDEGAERFNDVTVDPDGRVFAGTIGRTPATGGLYRIDLDGTITKLFGGTRNSNGAGFSADLRTFFWTDSTAKQICRFAYDRATGTLANRTVIVQLEPDTGTPDGLCVDADDNLWSARWGGGAVLKFSAQGELLDQIKMPVATVSCPCFGGADGQSMFVTTAKGEPGSDTEDGALFEVRGSFSGKIKFRSRILIASEAP